MAQARGKYAKAISDRSGMEFPYNEMVREWNGHLVHKSEFEAKHPQLELRSRSGDAQGLFDARPDRTEEEVARILGPDPFETISASIGTSLKILYCAFNIMFSNTLSDSTVELTSV